MPIQVDLDGLVCHVGPDNDLKQKTHAVLVHSNAHSARIFVKAQFRTDPNLGDFVHQLVPGQHISFGGGAIGTGAATTTGSFDLYVPRIQPLLEDSVATNRDLHPAVKNRQPHTHVRTYVTYCPGTLSAVWPLRDTLRLTTTAGVHIDDLCVADLTRYIARNTGVVTLTISGPNAPPAVDIVADAVVTITNWGVKHFQRYRDVTLAKDIARSGRGATCGDAAPRIFQRTANGADNDSMFIDMDGDAAPKGAKKKKGGPDDPECTNSAWP